MNETRRGRLKPSAWRKEQRRQHIKEGLAISVAVAGSVLLYVTIMVLFVGLVTLVVRHVWQGC